MSFSKKFLDMLQARDFCSVIEQFFIVPSTGCCRRTSENWRYGRLPLHTGQRSYDGGLCAIRQGVRTAARHRI